MSIVRPHLAKPAAFVRELGYDQGLKRIAGTDERLHELDAAIEWALQRSPGRFKCIGEDYYLWMTADVLNDFRPLRILYQYVEKTHTVYMISMSAVDDGEKRPPKKPREIDF